MNTFFKNYVWYLMEFILIQITDAWQVASTWKLRGDTEAGMLLLFIWALNILSFVI